MSFRQQLAKFWAIFRRRKRGDDLAEEIRSHLEMEEQENRGSGMSADDARYAAMRRFGNVTLVQEMSREIWSWVSLESFLQDIRYGFRQLRHNPGFTAVAALTLALGIGANTAIFSIVNAIFLRPLPFPHADRIFAIDRVGNPVGGSTISLPIYLAWQKQAEGFFDRIALLAWWGDATVSVAGDSERVSVAGTSSGILSILGVRPSLGRNFLPEEDSLSGRDVVILSDSLWRDKFKADPNIQGQTVQVDGRPHQVVGVLPPGFQLPIPGMREAQLWLPVYVPAVSDNAANGALICIGLLKENVRAAQAAAALTAPLADLRRQFPKMFDVHERARLQPLHDFLAARAGPAPLLLLGAVGLVLLLACANVANLTLARGASRRREVAVRAALGAGRWRMMRQLLTESVLLSLLGGVLGLIVCGCCLDLIIALAPADLPHVGAFGIDQNVLIFALILSAITGVACGLVPALSASTSDLNGPLKEANPRAGSSGHPRLRNALAAGEVGICLVLLVAAALTLESFELLMRVQPGFDPNKLLTFNISQRPKDFHKVSDRLTFYDLATTRLRSLPDIEQVALIDALPLEPGRDVLFTIEGPTPAQQSGVLDADFRATTPEFFEAMRIPLKRGREFLAADNSASAQVAIINQAMARMFFGEQDPIGQRIWIGKPMGPEWTEPVPREIVGVVGDIHGESLAGAPDPTIYVPYAQRPIVQAYFLIRTRQNPLASIPEIRKAMREVDADLPLAELKTMKEIISASLTEWRFRSFLLAAFGAVAVAIAIIGVYGVMSYSVAERTHEIGVRMALGAGRREVLKLVVGQGLKLTLAGVAIGLGAAEALTRLLAGLLFGVKAGDPLTFSVVSVILTAVALAACYLPARRATEIDPLTALRHE